MCASVSFLVALNYGGVRVRVFVVVVLVVVAST